VDEPADRGLSRSRGGLSTKIHALTDRFCCPLTVLLSPGQAGDNSYLLPLLEAHHAGDTEGFGCWRTRGTPIPSTRAVLRASRIAHTIPERSDQIARRKARGADGGRPPAFDAGIYKGAQYRRTRVRPTQGMARDRHPVRQVRHQLPGRRPTRLPDHPLPRPQ
jgi:putative transposase